MMQAEGVADRHHPVADLDAFRVAEYRRTRTNAHGSEQREIVLWIAAHDLRIDILTVGRADVNDVGILDHVGVGENQPPGIEDEPRAEPFLERLNPKPRRQTAKLVCGYLSKRVGPPSTTLLSHSLSTPASLLKSRSKVPRGKWPAFRATSKTKQSEKPNAGRLRKLATAAATASESCSVRCW